MLLSGIMSRPRRFAALPMSLVAALGCTTASGGGGSADAGSTAPAIRHLQAHGVSIDIPLASLYDPGVATSLTVTDGPMIEVDPGGEIKAPITVRLAQSSYTFSAQTMVVVTDGEFAHGLGELDQDATSYSFETESFSLFSMLEALLGPPTSGDWSPWAKSSAGKEGTALAQAGLPSRVDNTHLDCFVDVSASVARMDSISQPKCVAAGKCPELQRSDQENRLVSAEIAAKLPALRAAVQSAFGMDWDIALNGAWDSSGKIHRAVHSTHYSGRAVDLAVCRRIQGSCQKDATRLPAFAPIVNAVFAEGQNGKYFVQYEAFGKAGGQGDHVHASLLSPSVEACVKTGTPVANPGAGGVNGGGGTTNGTSGNGGTLGNGGAPGSGGMSGTGGDGAGGASGTGGDGAGGTSGGGEPNPDGGVEDVCCSCNFDVYCTEFGAGGCWYCHESTLDAQNVCIAPEGYLNAPGPCTCDPELFEVCQ
jgi:hypothetical protein